jgi:2-dehydro-3-deoxyphosphogluconate aldolase/(4S)-4-hydroxy-2-oxoglutarate aldolase
LNEIKEKIKKIGVVPVVKINDASKAVLLANALKRGGIPCVEVTFRTSEATNAIKNIASSDVNMIVGAGTVTTIRQVDLALESGAKFIVSPGFNEKIVKYCIEKNAPIIPGVFTSSEIEKAIEYDLDMVKFFPAEQGGGVNMIKALNGPYGNLMFIPTGGITESNICDYLALDCVSACGGSFMANPSLIDSNAFDEIEQICNNTIKKILGFTIKHIRINSTDITKSKTADFLINIFGFDDKHRSSLKFLTEQIQNTKKASPTKNGFLTIGTHNVDRAVYHLEQNELKFNHATALKDAKGNMLEIYLSDEITGFAIRFVKN